MTTYNERRTLGSKAEYEARRVPKRAARAAAAAEEARKLAELSSRLRQPSTANAQPTRKAASVNKFPGGGVLVHPLLR